MNALVLAALLLIRVGALGATVSAGTAGAPPVPPQGTMSMPMPAVGWNTHVDGNVFGTFDNQGGPRGDTAIRSQNWFMLMADHRLGAGELTLSGMASAEPLTAPNEGYPELFQEGEAYHGLQITDHQHPHNLVMQLAAAWRVPVAGFGVTLAGGPVGEAALGPVAFMHRPSSAFNPTAPLSHHIFDSTHVSNGVVLLGVDRGPVRVEASVFRGREPDEHRYRIELGALDSWSTRVWYQPTDEWTVQASYGFLHQPEQLEPGDQRRANASISWLRTRGDAFTAITVAYGQNARTFSTVHAWLAEATRDWGSTALYARAEDLTVETEILLLPFVVHVPHPGELVDPVRALTVGAVRDVWHGHRWAMGIGGDVTSDVPPPLLQILYGPHPLSEHVFLVFHPRSAGRMWNMSMGQPMVMSGAHSGSD